MSLYFAGCLYRGNRSTKVSAGSFDAFDSPNLPPLVTMKVKIEGKNCYASLYREVKNGWPLPTIFSIVHVSCFRLQWSVREQDRIVALDSSDPWLFYIHYFSILTIDPFKYFCWYSIAKTSLRRWVEMGFIGCTLFLLVILAIIKLFLRFLQF